MRELKFRVWCKDYNEWERDRSFLSQDGIVYHTLTLGTGIRAIRPENHVVQFFTGLRDKNGTEIYEGDIVQWNIEAFGQKEKMTSFVEYYFGRYVARHPDNQLFSLPMSYELSLWYNDSTQVIGNIFENPELLK